MADEWRRLGDEFYGYHIGLRDSCRNRPCNLLWPFQFYKLLLRFAVCVINNLSRISVNNKTTWTVADGIAVILLQPWFVSVALVMYGLRRLQRCCSDHHETQLWYQFDIVDLLIIASVLFSSELLLKYVRGGGTVSQTPAINTQQINLSITFQFISHLTTLWHVVTLRCD